MTPQEEDFEISHWEYESHQIKSNEFILVLQSYQNDENYTWKEIILNLDNFLNKISKELVNEIVNEIKEKKEHEEIEKKERIKLERENYAKKKEKRDKKEYKRLKEKFEKKI